MIKTLLEKAILDYAIAYLNKPADKKATEIVDEVVEKYSQIIDKEINEKVNLFRNSL